MPYDQYERRGPVQIMVDGVPDHEPEMVQHIIEQGLAALTDSGARLIGGHEVAALRRCLTYVHRVIAATAGPGSDRLYLESLGLLNMIGESDDGTDQRGDRADEAPGAAD